MFLHSFHPQSVLLDFGFIQIHWYGFLVTLSIILGSFVFYKLAQRAGYEKKFIFDLFFWLIIWGFIGGRLYHVLSEINYYWPRPLKIFYVWQGGLGIYGSMIAGILVICFFRGCHPCLAGRQAEADVISAEGSRGNKKSIFHWILRRSAPQNDILLILDFLAPALALGQAIGRWGNYFNQELYGLPTNLPWGIPIDLSNRIAGYENFQFFHPVFLYESLFCFLLFAIFFLFLSSRAAFRVVRSRGICLGDKHVITTKFVPPADSSTSALATTRAFGRNDKEKIPGFVFLLYLFFYSLSRFFLEFLRLDPQPIWLGLRLGQWSSLALAAAAVLMYFVLRKWYNKSIKAIEH